MELKIFRIDPRGNNGNSGETFTVESEHIADAAQLAARKLFRGTRGRARRTTGSPGGSGMFQVWERARTEIHTETARGHPFHVMEL